MLFRSIALGMQRVLDEPENRDILQGRLAEQELLRLDVGFGKAPALRCDFHIALAQDGKTKQFRCLNDGKQIIDIHRELIRQLVKIIASAAVGQQLQEADGWTSIPTSFGRGKDDVVFAGDLMHTPLQTRYPELSPKFDVDPKLAAATRRNFLQRYCDTDTLCCTAHFPSPSAGKIRRRGDEFGCEMV